MIVRPQSVPARWGLAAALAGAATLFAAPALACVGSTPCLTWPGKTGHAGGAAFAGAYHGGYASAPVAVPAYGPGVYGGGYAGYGGEHRQVQTYVEETAAYVHGGARLAVAPPTPLPPVPHPAPDLYGGYEAYGSHGGATGAYGYSYESYGSDSYGHGYGAPAPHGEVHGGVVVHGAPVGYGHGGYGYDAYGHGYETRGYAGGATYGHGGRYAAAPTYGPACPHFEPGVRVLQCAFSPYRQEVRLAGDFFYAGGGVGPDFVVGGGGGGGFVSAGARGAAYGFGSGSASSSASASASASASSNVSISIAGGGFRGGGVKGGGGHKGGGYGGYKGGGKGGKH